MLKNCLFSILLFLILAATSTGQACCFYNHAYHPLAVNGPYAKWVVHPSNHRCTDGKGGSYTLQIVTADYKFAFSTSISLDVDDHGWITVSPPANNTWTAESKDKNGNPTEMKQMHAISSGKKVPLSGQ